MKHGRCFQYAHTWAYRKSGHRFSTRPAPKNSKLKFVVEFWEKFLKVPLFSVSANRSRRILETGENSVLHRWPIASYSKRFFTLLRTDRTYSEKWAPCYFKDSFPVYEEHILAIWFEIFLDVSAGLSCGADSHIGIGTGFLMVKFVRCVDAHVRISGDVKYFIGFNCI